MIKIHHLLVPIDYTERAYRAFIQASHLARRHDATVHVLRVIMRNTLSLGAVLQNLSFGEVDVAEQLRLSAARYKHLNNGAQVEDNVQIVHAEQHATSVAAGILAYAETRDIDLIVMGALGRNDDFELIHQENVTEEVIRRASCPVLSVRTETRPQPRHDIQRILAPVDFSPASPASIAYAKALAAAYEAELNLLHVLEEPSVPRVYNTDQFFSAVPKQTAESRQAFEALARGVEGLAVPFQCHALVGHPAQVILDFAEAQGIDLIVMAPHSLVGIRQRLLGSVTEKVVREASCLVAAVKPTDKTLVAESFFEEGNIRAT